MNSEIKTLEELFLKILHLYTVIGRKPKDYGTGDLLYLTEVHTIIMVGKNKELNMTKLAEMMGVTKGAISQTIRKLSAKNLIVKQNSTNNKEFNLKLTEKGRIVYDKQEAFNAGIFSFAESLYMKAKPQDREIVKQLFIQVIQNMQGRVRA